MCGQIVEDLVDVLGVVEASFGGGFEDLVVDVLAVAREPAVVG